MFVKKTETVTLIRKWLELRSNIPWLKKVIWVIGVLRRTVVCDWRLDNLCGSYLQCQVIVLVSWKFYLLANQIAHQGFCIFNWLRLWRWLQCRLSKRQSQTTVLLRTPITQMTFFNQGMLLLGSNHFLIRVTVSVPGLQSPRWSFSIKVSNPNPNLKITRTQTLLLKLQTGGLRLVLTEKFVAFTKIKNASI